MAALSGIPGIHSRMAEPLSKALMWFQDDLSRSMSKAGIEIGGVFVANPETWTVDSGWDYSVDFVPVTNETSARGAFHFGAEQASELCMLRMDLRQAVCLRVCEEMGWDDGASDWTKVVSARLRGSRDVVRELETKLRGEARDSVSRGPGLWGGIVPDSAWVEGGERFVHEMDQIVETGIDSLHGELVAAFGGGILPHISAFNFLMMTAPQILGGLIHTHPGGNEEISPQDLLAVQVFRQYQDAFSFGSAQLDTYQGGMERVVLAGHWVVSISDSGYANGIVKYDDRGPRMVIRQNGGADFRNIMSEE